MYVCCRFERMCLLSVDTMYVTRILLTIIGRLEWNLLSVYHIRLVENTQNKMFFLPETKVFHTARI